MVGIVCVNAVAIKRKIKLKGQNPLIHNKIFLKNINGERRFLWHEN